MRFTAKSLGKRLPKKCMPEVSRFYGIIIRFYYRVHPPEQFHAIYGEHEALIESEIGNVRGGFLPHTAYDLVNAWRLAHLQELRDDWQRAGKDFHCCRSRRSSS
jgi:hypothetical protein